MLKIFVGDSKTTIRPVSQYFGAIYKPEWLEDLGCSVESLGQYCTEEMEKRIHYDKSKLANCLHVDRDCLRCQWGKKGCEYQTNRPSRELFIYGPLKSLESKTSETENIAVF